MAYNEALVKRVSTALAHLKKVEEKKMFGGLTFMVNGKMCVGISNDDLMVRLDPTIYDSVLKKTGCREMNFTGKSMKGFVFVSPEGTKSTKDLEYWIDLALDFNKKVKTSKKNEKYATKEVI